MRKSIFFFIISVFLTQSVNAQWLSNTSLNTLISDDATYNETYPICALGLNGSTYVSWFQSNSSGSFDAMLQLLDSNGYAAWPLPLVVSNHPQSTALYTSDFTSDNGGNALMAFQDIRNGDLQTVIYKIDANGNFLWGANGIQLHDVNATFEAAPKIAVFNNDDVVVSWSASATGNKWVAWQIIDASGNAMFGNPQTIDSPTVNYSRAQPVMINTSSFMLVYVQETGSFPGLTSLIFCQQYNASGVAQWPSAIQISSFGLGFVAVPLAITDNLGGCYIAFNSGAPGAPAINDAFVQRINPLGVTLFGNDGIELCALATNHRFVKDIMLNNNDNKLYALLKVTDSGQNGAGVYAQAIDNAGSLQFTNNAMEVVPITTINPAEPFTIDNAGNGCFITYTEGVFNNQAIKAHKIGYSGTLLFSNPVDLSNAISNKSRLTSSAMQSGNQLVVTWEDSRINQGVYAQNMSNGGNVGQIVSTKPTPENNQVCVINMHHKQINLIGTNNAELVISNNLGQVILTQHLHEGINEINNFNQADGTYLYQVKTKDKLSNGKFVFYK
jgi:hypothetical protein